MNNVSVHAFQRANERVSRKSRRQAEQLFAWLWGVGIPAVAADFLEFQAANLPGRHYRVCERGRARYLVARDAITRKFITIIKK